VTAILADSRTELVRQRADEVEHSWCGPCWKPGIPALCGEPDYDGEECPEDCGHPKCSLCLAAWEKHECGGARRLA
jgi:hypothetical protein